MDAENKGEQELKSVIKEIEFLIENQSCPDTLLSTIAEAIRGIIRIKVRQQLSKTQAARYLNVDIRTIQRMVDDKRIPKPHRDGMRGIFWFIDELDAVIQHSKNK